MIILSQPVGQYGPGIVLKGTVSGFPVSGGDYVESIVTSGLLRASYTAAQVTDVSIGLFEGVINLDRQLGNIPKVEAGLLPTAAISLLINWKQSNGTLVDSVVLSGYSWDPFTGLAGLFAALYDFDSFLQQILQFDVLPSVRKTY